MTNENTSALPKIAARLAQGKTVRSAWVSQDMMAGITFSRLGFDAITFDLQHSRHDAGAVMHAIAAVVLSGKPVGVRVPIGDFQLASRLLDTGASCIIAPMISTADDARRFVSHCKYPPVGERSWGPFDAVAFSGLSRAEYLATANSFSLTIAMVETRESVDNIDAILAVDGIDGVFVGSADLAVSLTNGRQVDGKLPEVQEALDRIVSACKRAGKTAGIYCMSGEAAREAQARGFRLLAVGSDTVCMTEGARHMLAIAVEGDASR